MPFDSQKACCLLDGRGSSQVAGERSDPECGSEKRRIILFLTRFSIQANILFCFQTAQALDLRRFSHQRNFF
jgi:hypothetical protein